MAAKQSNPSLDPTIGPWMAWLGESMTDVDFHAGRSESMDPGPFAVLYGRLDALRALHLFAGVVKRWFGDVTPRSEDREPLIRWTSRHGCIFDLVNMR